MDKKVAAIIGSTRYAARMIDLKQRLEQQGMTVMMPKFDREDTSELGVALSNRKNIHSADIVYVLWDRRSYGTVFDLGMCFALRRPIIMEYLEPRTFEGLFEQYERYSKTL